MYSKSPKVVSLIAFYLFPFLLGNTTSKQICDYCQYLIDNIRNDSESQFDNLFSVFISSPQGNLKINNGNNDTIEIELPKHKFKKYEPIDVLFRYINKGSVDDSIGLMFESIMEFTRFQIINQNDYDIEEKQYHSFTPGLCVEPHYIVGPGDTLFETMNLNSYGKLRKNKDKEESCWDNYYNFIPVGKYKVKAFITGDVNRIFEPPIQTNEIEFEVIELNDEDRTIIKLENQGKIDGIIVNYPNSSWVEYAFREKIQNAWRKYYENGITINEIKELYSQFFDVFPDSYLNIGYVNSYLNIITDDYATNIEPYLQKLISIKENSFISKYLSNGLSIRQFKRNAPYRLKYDK